MKSLKVGFWMVLVGILILPAASVAETVYVSEDFEITMRTGPGSDRKIISLVQRNSFLQDTRSHTAFWFQRMRLSSYYNHKWLLGFA